MHSARILYVTAANSNQPVVAASTMDVHVALPATSATIELVVDLSLLIHSETDQFGEPYTRRAIQACCMAMPKFQILHTGDPDCMAPLDLA
jgi:hypothetical protein